jgi:hypothetical protein
MRNILSMLAAMVIAVGSLASAAEAAPIAGQAAVTQSAVELGNVEKTAYVWGGHNYCWYDGGWRGPGWYWCGYAWRHGLGWGGARGWRGWSWHGWHGGHRVGHHGVHRGGHGGHRVSHHGGHGVAHHGGGHRGGNHRGGGGHRGGGRRR